VSIIVKFILKNIREKKYRTFLMVFSIMISSALFFAASGVSTTIEKMYKDMIRSNFGNAEIMVVPGPKSSSNFLSESESNTVKDEMEYIIGSIQLSGFYNHTQDDYVSMDLRGYDLGDLKVMNKDNDFGVDDLEKNEIILSKSSAKKYNLQIGDNVNIDINNKSYKFKVAALSESRGIFTSENPKMVGLVAKSMLSDIYEGKDRVTTLYFKLKDSSKKQEYIKELTNIYKDYTVKEPLQKEEIEQRSALIVSGLSLMDIIILLISIFIIYSAFKIITTERLPIIGTFRSIGATKKRLNFILLTESVLYGIIGGLVGLLAGVGVLYLLSQVIRVMYGWGNNSIKFTPVQMVEAFIVAIILSVVSSLVPIIKVSKLPVKDIVLNKVSRTDKKKSWRIFLGIIFIVLGLILPRYAPKDYALIIDGVSMVMLFVSTIIMVPYITLIFVRIFEKIYGFIFGNEGIIAAKNLNGNKSVLSNISLLAVGISTLLIINIVSTSLVKEIPNIFKEFNYNISITGGNLDAEFKNSLSDINGVSETYGVYKAQQVKIDGENLPITELDGVGTDSFNEFHNIKFENSEAINKLPNDRNIILSDLYKDRMKLKEGDKINIQLYDTKKEYTVSGFMDTQWQNGSFAIISDKYFKEDFGAKAYTEIYVKTTQNSSEVSKSIKKQYSKKEITTMTLEELTDKNVELNKQLMGMLSVYAMMAMAIGIFGVINNFIISFMERKRSIAMLRSIGMSKWQNKKILIIESATGGAIAGAIGILSSVLITNIVPYLIKITSRLDLPMHLSGSIFIVSFFAGVIVTILASVGPTFMSSRLNIIESLKYE
jgi:putative ABC transport system permease protein